MTNTNTIKKPIIKSVLYTFLILLFPVAAGIIIGIFSLNEPASLLIQAAFFALAFLCGLLIIKKSHFSYVEIGYRVPAKKSISKLLFLFPIIIIEVLPLLNGVRGSLNAPIIFSTLIFMACVGLTEELYFRGIILNLSKVRGVNFAIIFSSFLFSIGHLSNLASDADITLTLLQVLFAFLFGLVACEITVQSKSIIIATVWHFTHNTIATLTAENGIFSEFTLVILQCIILLAFYLYSMLQRKKPSLSI